MMRPPAIVAAAVLAGVTTFAADVAVVDPAGKPVARATALCVDPASAEPLLVTAGKVALAESCRRVRCDAAGFLPGEADLTAAEPRCVLRPATVISGELPAAAAARGLEARLLAIGKAAPVVTRLAVPKAAAGAASTRFTLPPVKPGTYSLEIARPEDGWACRADAGPIGPGRQRVSPVWREPVALPVRVKGADGKPLANVPARAWTPRPVPRETGSEQASIGAWICGSTLPDLQSTDATGLARLNVDLAGEALVVVGDFRNPRGLAYATFDRVPAEPAALTLAAPVVVRAKVLDEKDRPLACDVFFADLPADVAWLTKVAGGSTVKSLCDPQGGFALGPLPSIPLTLEVRPRTGLPLRVPIDAPPPGTTADLGVLRVRSGESFRVVVHDDLDGPVAGAKVTLRGSSGILLTVEGTTGDDGAVDLSGLPKNATVSFDVKAKGFLPKRESGLDLDASPRVVRLARGAAISGAVRDLDGAPVAGARVGLTGEKSDRREVATTDARGAFTFDGVDDGAWRLTAKADGFAESEPAAVEVTEHRSIEDVAIKLVPAEGISGRVVDGAGTPLAGARVQLVSSPERDDLAPLAEALSASDGTYQVRAAPIADAWLIATKPGFGPCAVRAPDPASHAEQLLTLTESAALVVHMPRGARTSRKLRVRDGAGIGRSAASSGATELTFSDLAPGRGDAGFVPGPVRDVSLVARQTAEVTLDAASAVEGRVTFDGAPAARAFVMLIQEPATGRMDQRGGSFTDERGHYRIDGLIGGGTDPYRIAAVGEDGRAEATFTLADGETARVDLALRAVRLIVSVVDGGTEKPVPRTTVAVAPAGKGCGSMMGSSSWGDPGELGFEISVGSNGCTSAQTDAAGVARLSLSAPGSYDLEVGDDSFESWKQAISLGEGTTTKRVVLTRKPDKSGDKPHVIANLRTTPPGLSGGVECRSEGNVNSSSPVSGRYECGAMHPGPGEVNFYVEGYGRGRATFDVPQTGELVVEVDVPKGGTVVVPVSQDSTVQPALVDGSGFAWSDGTGNSRIAARLEELPSVGRAWVFRDVPPGTYTVTIDGKARSPVPLSSGGTAVAN